MLSKVLLDKPRLSQKESDMTRRDTASQAWHSALGSKAVIPQSFFFLPLLSWLSQQWIVVLLYCIRRDKLEYTLFLPS